VLALALLPTGCLFDPDDRCGENQVFEDGACACTDDAAFVDGVCVACDEGEVPTDAGCVCAAGLAPSADGGCEESIAGLGRACAGDDDCEPEGASLCLLEDGETEGVCTVGGCETAADCPLEYACDVARDPALCLPPPTGYGAPCESASDCAEFEASYCETLQEKVCLVECAADPGLCLGDYACCDYGSLGATAVCVPPGELVDGACPAGGVLKEPG
jgi:hypothetical protein